MFAIMKVIQNVEDGQQQSEFALPPRKVLEWAQDMLDKLRGLNGKDFAKQYMDDQVSAHKQAVSLFQRYGKGGDNEPLKGWAAQTLPTLQHHLDMAQGIYKDM
jgi:putative membrane protein